MQQRDGFICDRLYFEKIILFIKNIDFADTSKYSCQTCHMRFLT